MMMKNCMGKDFSLGQGSTLTLVTGKKVAGARSDRGLCAKLLSVHLAVRLPVWLSAPWCQAKSLHCPLGELWESLCCREPWQPLLSPG